MYKLPDGQLDIYEVYCPLERLLNPENRFCRWAGAIPWEELELEWSGKLYSRRGAPAKPLRLILGAFLIREKFDLSERETLREIEENPYMQYFIGLKEFAHEPPFNVSLLAQFRRRLDPAARRMIRRVIRDYMK